MQVLRKVALGTMALPLSFGRYLREGLRSLHCKCGQGMEEPHSKTMFRKEGRIPERREKMTHAKQEFNRNESGRIVTISLEDKTC